MSKKIKNIFKPSTKNFVFKLGKATTISLVVLSTILYSIGLPFIPVAQAAVPKINLVQYINPTTFQVRFDQAINGDTIVAGSFTLHTNATDTETIDIDNVSSATVAGITTATVVATGAKISPTYTDWVKVACGNETYAPKNAGTEANSDCGNIGFIMIQGSVVISEVQISGGTEGTAKQEFIEFYNRTGSAIDLNGYQLKYAIADGTETVLMADLDGSHEGTDIPAQGFYLVSNAAYTPALVADTWSNTIDIPANATILLYHPQGAVVDMVGFGTNSATPSVLREGQQATFGAELSQGKSLERKAVPTSTSATMATSGAHAAWGNGQDSNNNDFDFAIRTTPQPQNSASTAETPSGQGGYENQPPTINHMPIAQVVSSGTQAATVFAMMADAETPATSLVPQLFYKTPSGSWTPVTGQYVSGQPFKFTIPAAATGSGSGTAFIYYLKVTDNNSPVASVCMYATGTACGTSDATAQATGAPWTVTSVSGGAWTNSIKGRVVISGTSTGIDNASVTLRGAGLTFITNSATDTGTTPATTGAFTFSNVPGGIFRVEAVASGYLDGWLDSVPSKTSGAAYTDWSVGLTAGSGGGQGGDINKPMVTFSAPMDGMMAAPTKINIPSGTGQIEAPIMIGFSKDMDTTTITSDNIKIYPVTAAGLGTALTGVSVAYQAQAGTATLTDRGNRSVEFGPDRKAILYSAPPEGANSALSVNSQYAVVLSTSVKDTAGNVLQGNKPGGGHAISFTTAGDFSNYSGAEMATSFQTFMAGGGGGQFSPPYVTGSTPSNGAKNVPTNAKIIVNFSQPMDSFGINATNSQGTYVKLDDTNYNNSGSGQYVTVASITLDNNTKQSATITVGGSGLVASHSNYAIRVFGGAKSATGMAMAMPDRQNTVMYQADFSTGAGSDTSNPTVLSTTLQTYTSTAPCAAGVNVCVSGVPINVGVIEVSFSKDMDTSTINSSNITLKSGNTAVSTTVTYDQLSRSVKIAPDTALYTTTTYALTVTTNVKAMNTAALSSNYVVSFATSSTVDQVAPTIQFANGDDYKLAITFSEPMNSAKATDTNNYGNASGGASVLNPANYILYTDNGPPPSGGTALYFVNANLSTATTTETGGPLTFKYDAAYNTVVIEGLRLMAGVVKGGFRLWVKNVKDLSGNIIQDTSKPANASDFGANSAGGGVMNSNNTFGMIGPGGGGMSGPPTSAMLSGGTMQVTAFGGKDPSMMGFKPINVNPVNMLAGQESLYMIDIPLSSAIPDDGQIVLTFPIGFDVTNATDADLSKLWAHKDLNGPGAGTVTIASISPNTNDKRTITITLDVAGATATQANDFLHLEIDRIKNTTKATDGDISTGVTMGSGYQVDILTKTSATGGRTLETLKSMPFFIKAGGTSTLTGSLTVKNAGGANVAIDAFISLFLSSPMTGPLKALVDFDVGDGGVKTYTFSNLPTGMYMLSIEPIQTIGGIDYYTNLNPIPQSIEITAGTVTKNIIFQAQSSTNKPNLKVYITGTFTNEQIDIFAGGPGGFAVKTVALNGPYTNAVPSDNTVYLPGTGTFMIGIGPAMPKGPQQSGPPSMPNWMPPQSIEVTASGSGPNWTWQDNNGAAADDASATDGKITFGIITAGKTITGHVYGPTGTTGTGIQNAEVFAYSPVGGMSSHATSDANGAFTLKVIEGSYQVGTFIPGMPPSPETPVEVKTVANVTTIYANGVATSDVILRIQNPGTMYTISGKVTDGTNVIKDASVYARRTDAPGNVGTKTDSMGKYILYVQAGIWTVGVFLPQYGNLTEQTVTVTTASKADIDFAATTTNYNTVSDRVYKDVNANGSYDAGDTLIANAHVDFVNTTTGYRNTAITDSSGLYKTNLPDGIYTATAWISDTGKMTPQTVTVNGNINVDGSADIMTPGDTKTITVNFVDGAGQPVTLDKVYVQMDKIGSKDISNEVNRDNVSSLTLNVPAGTDFQYALDIDIPGITDSALTVASPNGGVVAAQDIIAGGAPEMYQIKVADSQTLNVTIPTLYTVSGVAEDKAGNPLSNTIINIKKPGGSDVSMEVKTNSLGEYSVDLPTSGATPYLFQIDKAGYIDTSVSVAVTTADVPNTDLDATKASLTIEGQIKVGATGVEGAKVYAKELGGGFASTETDAQGNYVLSVAAGDWKISTTSDAYQEEEYQNASGQDIVIPVSTSNTTGINITLDTLKSGLAGLNNADVTPSSGATFEHSSANLEIFVPQNAIATSQATYQLEDKEVSNVTSTPTAKTIGGEAVEIMAYEPSGSSMVPKTSFNDDVTIEKKYTKAELVAEGIDTFTEADAVKMSYFDESASNWEPLLTDVTYLNSSEQAVIPTANLSNVEYLIYAGISDHMTVFAPTNPTPDGLAPAAPTGLQVTAGTGSSVTISWTAPTLNADGSAYLDPLGYEIYRSTNGTSYVQINASDVLTTSYSDTSASSWTSYYYKVTAADTGGIESNLSSAVQTCSNITVTNGTVINTCTITCNSGYSLSGHTCSVMSLGGGGGALPPAPITEKVEEEKAEEVVEKPIAEMTPTEKAVKIIEVKTQIEGVQTQLINLIKQLIEIIVAQIAELTARL